MKMQNTIKSPVIPQAGQEMPVTCLKRQTTGKNCTTIKNKNNINKIYIFFILFIINLLMEYLVHQYL